MEIIISVVVAYLLLGAAYVIRDLRGGILGPRWAWTPTVGKAIFVAATWVKRSITINIIDSISSDVSVARAIAFGLLGVILDMCVLTGFIWCCIIVSAHILHSVVLQIVAAAILVIVGALLVLPLLKFLTMPLALIIMWPLDLLFPRNERINVGEIKWCRNCKHRRKSKEYEDVISGLWRSKSMPRSDKLPCNIILETAGVWERYFKAEPDARALFPNDCEFFEKRT